MEGMKHNKTRKCINEGLKCRAKIYMSNIWESYSIAMSKMFKRCCLENLIHGIVREMMMHCELGKWWCSIAEIWSSCTLGLGPRTYHAPVLCLSAGLSASCRLPVRRWSPGGKKSWPPPAGLPSDGLLSTSPCTAALPSGASSVPLCLLFSLFVHTDTLFVAQTH